MWRYYIKLFKRMLLLLTPIILIITIFERLVFRTPPRINLKPHQTIEDYNIMEKMDNLPDIYLNQSLGQPYGINKTCGRYPRVIHLNYHNLYWQTFATGNDTFQIYNAYYDNRSKNTGAPTVRILAHINYFLDTWESPWVLLCALWFAERIEPVFVRISEYKFLWRLVWVVDESKRYYPHLLSCNVPKYITEVPISVSIVEKECDPITNNIKIHYENPDAKENFAVCVKGMHFDSNYSYRLIEWIEVLSLLGVHKIFMYIYFMNPKIKKILHYYIMTGKVVAKPISLAGFAPNIPKWQKRYLKLEVLNRQLHEMIAFNDCFYKNIHKYKYVINLDPDEVIVPKQGDYNNLLKSIEEPGVGAYAAQMTYYFDEPYDNKFVYQEDIPKEMHMLQHVYRSANYSELWGGYAFAKAFISTSEALTTHNHMPLTYLGQEKKKLINTELAHLQHYRKCVKGWRVSCLNLRYDTIYDPRMLNLKHELMNRFVKAVEEIFDA